MSRRFSIQKSEPVLRREKLNLGSDLSSSWLVTVRHYFKNLSLRPDSTDLLGIQTLELQHVAELGVACIRYGLFSRIFLKKSRITHFEYASSIREESQWKGFPQCFRHETGNIEGQKKETFSSRGQKRADFALSLGSQVKKRTEETKR
jgi:hypothetical protein